MSRRVSFTIYHPDRTEPRLDDFAMTSETAADRYRREAEECRRNADEAMRPVDREAWQRLAAEWAKLAESADLKSLLRNLRRE